MSYLHWCKSIMHTLKINLLSVFCVAKGFFFYPHGKSYKLTIFLLQYSYFEIFRINIIEVCMFPVVLQEMFTNIKEAMAQLFSIQCNLFTWQVKCFNAIIFGNNTCLKADRYYCGIFMNSYFTEKKWPCELGHWPLGTWIHTWTENNAFDHFILSLKEHQHISQTHILA